MNGRKLTGLFLGAGFSYELGMPLVGEFTAQIRRVLPPAKLRTFIEKWCEPGNTYSSHVVEDVCAALARPEFHYESFLGHLEVQRYRSRGDRKIGQDYYAFYTHFVDVISLLLYERHTANTSYIQGGISYYDGLKALASSNCPLWVFSLNHDVMVECIGSELGIPVSSGFTDEMWTLPRRDASGKVVGSLTANVLPLDRLKSRSVALPFLPHGQPGVNLLKLHGALDIFGAQDKYLLKLNPTGPGAPGAIDMLVAANDGLRYHAPNRQKLHVPGHLAYADASGDLQLLVRTLSSGAHKFDPRHSSHYGMPSEILTHFESYLLQVEKLICIGYGFGDLHINKSLRDWLGFSKDRHLEIVNPGIAQVPVDFLHLCPQISLKPQTTTEYLDEVAGIKRERLDTLNKRFRNFGRTRPDVFQAFAKFANEHLQRKLESIVKKVADGEQQPDDLSAMDPRKMHEEAMDSFLKDQDGANR